MPTIENLEQDYRRKHSKSHVLYERALLSLPSGVTHDARYVKPFPVYCTKAMGAKKWDVDGNEYVDYVMGHGALLLGYGDERISAALAEHASQAVHIGACTSLEVEWAELIRKLVPCARDGLVRATASGTEAVQMAIRLARIYASKEKVVLHMGSYHGKGDNTIIATNGPPYGKCNTAGITEGIKKDVVLIPYNALDKVEQVFKADETACIILQGNALYTEDYIKGVRQLATEYGVVFILDEVVSGFRYAPGGAQEYYGVIPDLAVLGKIIGGGAPIGAICGKREILDFYSFKDSHWNKFMRIKVGGTWNAQPISIVGGIATMKIIEKEKETLYPRLYSIGKRIVKNFNEYAQDSHVAALGTGLPPDNPTTISLDFFSGPVAPEDAHIWQTGPSRLEDYEIKTRLAAPEKTMHANHLSMLNNGVFCNRGNFFVTCTKYTEEDLQKTALAIENSLQILRQNNLVGVIR